MSVHKSLHTGGALVKHRNVLSRMERIKILEEAGRWNEEKDSVLGLRKVKNIKTAAKKKAAKKEAVAGAATPGAAAPGAAAPGAAAPGAPAPAAGAKAAAPAGKKEAGKK